jgi:hypothetical protein
MPCSPHRSWLELERNSERLGCADRYCESRWCNSGGKQLAAALPDRTSELMASHMNSKVNRTMFWRFVVVLAAAIVSFDALAWRSFQQSESESESREHRLLDAIKHWKQFQFVISDCELCDLRTSLTEATFAHLCSELRLDPPSTRRGLECGRLSAAGSYFIEPMRKRWAVGLKEL